MLLHWIGNFFLNLTRLSIHHEENYTHNVSRMAESVDRVSLPSAVTSKSLSRRESITQNLRRAIKLPLKARVHSDDGHDEWCEAESNRLYHIF